VSHTPFPDRCYVKSSRVGRSVGSARVGLERERKAAKEQSE